MSDLHVGDIGTTLTITVEEDGVAVDLSTSTAKSIRFQKPSGDTAAVTPAFGSDGSDGILEYEFVDGDLDEAGTWEMQVIMTFGTDVWSTTKSTFRVLSVIAAPA